MRKFKKRIRIRQNQERDVDNRLARQKRIQDLEQKDTKNYNKVGFASKSLTFSIEKTAGPLQCSQIYERVSVEEDGTRAQEVQNRGVGVP